MFAQGEPSAFPARDSYAPSARSSDLEESGLMAEPVLRSPSPARPSRFDDLAPGQQGGLLSVAADELIFGNMPPSRWPARAVAI